jgi:GTPase SAR1 family protein
MKSVESKNGSKIANNATVTQSAPSPSAAEETNVISESEIQLALGQGKRAWGRSKIMIVGEGRAGKTALANSLIGKSFEETVSTLGINQLTCDVKVASVGSTAWDVCSNPTRELELALAKIVAESRQNQKQQQITSQPQTSATTTTTSALDLQRLRRQLPSSLDEDSKPVIALEVTAIETGNLDVASIESNNGEKTESANHITDADLSGNNCDRKASLTTLSVDESALIKCLANNVQFNSKYILSIFDFGGQSIFDVIHPFFLTHYGIYVIAFNMEWLLPHMKDSKEYKDCLQYISFWLNNIVVHTQDKEHGQISPIILVGTRKDKISDLGIHEYISTQLYQQFSHSLAWSSIVENSQTDGRNGNIDLFFFPIDNKAGREGDPMIRKLLQAIEPEIDQADYVHAEQPLTWFKTYDEMMATGKAVLTWNETEVIAEKCGMFISSNHAHRKRSLTQFLLFLHQMGMLMWHEEEGLRDLVILLPIDYFVRPATIIICKL